jgi:hypothetical protein
MTYSVGPKGHQIFYDLGESQLLVATSIRFAKSLVFSLNREIKLREFIEANILDNDDIPIEIVAGLSNILEEQP